jgi:hypothetical protein
MEGVTFCETPTMGKPRDGQREETCHCCAGSRASGK